MTTYNNLEEWIRTENKNDNSVDDQVVVARWFCDRSITVVDDRVVRTSQVTEHVEHRLEYRVRTSLDNLEGIGVLLQIDPPGSGRYIRHHRSGQNFYDPSAGEFVPLLEEDISRLVDDLASRSQQTPQLADGGAHENENDGPAETLRSAVANALDVAESDVEHALTGPSSPIERMNRYDLAVKAVKDSDVVTRNRNYDEMGWRNSALRWTLSERATHMEMNQSLPT
jgi:hypothetical protein